MKARIPADVEMADRIFAGLTIRQLAVAGLNLAVLWSCYYLMAPRLPFVLTLALCAPIAAIGLAVVWVQPSGLPAERFLLFALRHALSPKKMTPKSDPLPSQGRSRSKESAPFSLPLRRVDDDGTLDLGSEGVAIVARCSSLNLGLRSEAEQDALIAGFARLLNSLDGPMQFLIRAERVDASQLLTRLGQRARSLPNPQLRSVAADYARFIDSLTSGKDMLRHSVMLSIRQPHSDPGAVQRLRQRMDETGSLLRQIGVHLYPMDGAEASHTIRQSTDPASPFHPRCGPGGVVRASKW
ncbi:hypothetical protein BH23ACT12_BH23ACT12_20700 [soil metagenome]